MAHFPSTPRPDSRSFSRGRFLLVLLSGLPFLSSCDPAAPRSDGGQPSVVCTTNMIGDLVNEIVGGRLEVTTLMGAGVDPHLYRFTREDLTALDRARVVFYNGLHLEGRMGGVLDKLSSSRLTVALAEKVDRAKLMTPEEYEGSPDPHIWFDIELWSQTIPAVVEALSRVDPAGAEEYRERGEVLRQEYLALDAHVREQIATIPEERRVLVTAHDAFGYFGRRYSIEVLALQGMSTVAQAGIRDIERVVQAIVDRKIKAIFVESSVPRRTVEAVIESCRSQGHEVKIGGELYSDAMGAPGTPGGTYPGMIRHNVEAIVSSLR